MSDLFARVRPVVGETLGACRVAALGSPAAMALVDYLAACGVRHWLALAGNEWFGAQVATLQERYGSEFDIKVERVGTEAEMASADLALIVDDAAMACCLPVTVPRLAIFSPTTRRPCRALLAMAGERFDPSALCYALDDEAECDHWGWQTAAPLMALCGRAVLLRETEYAMATWEGTWAKGLRAYTVGCADDPTQPSWQLSLPACQDKKDAYRSPQQRRGALLVVGVGSLGSVAARQLAPWVERLVLVDPDCVEAANLARQCYTHQQLGKPKAVALAQALGAAHPALACEAVVAALKDEREVCDLIDRYGVTGALVTTGTQADFAVARALRARALPHVVGRCYARAHFWEGIVVDGGRGPSYEQMRRQVAAGPTPAPTPEEQAAYGAVGELAGEPATAMETGWAAMWLARLLAQMMMPATLREGWLLARLAAGGNCFVGGLVVERVGEGVAYGVGVPGQLHAWSIEEIG